MLIVGSSSCLGFRFIELGYANHIGSIDRRGNRQTRDVRFTPQPTGGLGAWRLAAPVLWPALVPRSRSHQPHAPLLRGARREGRDGAERQRTRVLRPRGPAPVRAVPPARGGRAPEDEVGRPQSNGFIERFHRTLLDEHLRVKGALPGTSRSRRCRPISMPTSRPTTGTARTAVATWRGGRRTKSSRRGSGSPRAGRSQPKRR